VVLIEEGQIALNLPVRLPRPRYRGSVELTSLVEQVLERVLGTKGSRQELQASSVI